MSIVDRLLKLAHLLGLVLFLGSILSFIVLTTLADAGSISDLAFARRAISAGTTALTVPDCGASPSRASSWDGDDMGCRTVLSG